MRNLRTSAVIFFLTALAVLAVAGLGMTDETATPAYQQAPAAMEDQSVPPAPMADQSVPPAQQ